MVSVKQKQHETVTQQFYNNNYSHRIIVPIWSRAIFSIADTFNSFSMRFSNDVAIVDIFIP